MTRFFSLSPRTIALSALLLRTTASAFAQNPEPGAVPEATTLKCEAKSASDPKNFSCAPAESEAGPSKYSFLIPAYIMTQHGGYMGMVTVGTGWAIGRGPYSFELNFQVGYSPAFAAGDDVFQIDGKLEWHPLGGNRIEIPIGDRTLYIDPLHVGLGVIYGIDKDLFVKVPPQYPEKHYYRTNAIRLAPSIGLSARYGAHSVFFELTTLDVQVDAFFRDAEHVELDSFKGLGTYGLGYKFNFR